MGVGYIIGPTLAALNFTGGLLAWGFLFPLLLYFLGPELIASFQANGVTEITDETWIGLANNVWRTIVRPIAIGGMLMSAAFTLIRMRKSLGAGFKSYRRCKKAASGGTAVESRTEKDMNFKWVFIRNSPFCSCYFCYLQLFLTVMLQQQLLQQL
jgi:uncharacterized oligopeptide transporter (OPT) family protein